MNAAGPRNYGGHTFAELDVRAKTLLDIVNAKANATMAGERLLKRQTASEQVADYISSMIVSGELVGGQQIRQEAIAERLGVSRIPVREALLVLEAAGLVINRPHRGAVVAMLSVDDAHDVFASRLMIEPLLVARGVENATKDDVAAASKAMLAYEDAVARQAAEAELNALNWELHLCLMRPSGMMRMLSFVETLLGSADRYLRLQIRPVEARQKAISDHRELLDAFNLRLPERARDLTHRHIVGARDEIIMCLSRMRAADAQQKNSENT